MAPGKKLDIAKLVFALAIPQAAGVIGAVFTYPSISGWYAFLVKPEFMPPSWVFAPAWTLLYLLMGASLYLILKRPGKEARKAAIVFGFQLALNVIWSILFFGLRNPALAFTEILALWAMIGATIWQFMKIDKRAAYMMVPYILWVTFAAVLNYYVWILNA
ncbi:MAG TPA: TspO/MBR family protein [archaeon]|nr:tryptophan-rich sensory protein [Candidatus Aenigmarchaeota archaeon]HLD83515.1 TspO/MBR family protein [archaeon]